MGPDLPPYMKGYGLKGSRCPRGGELDFSKNQQQLNPKQEPNFIQQLAIREYY